MSNDKFDFNTASALVRAVDAAAKTLENKNTELEGKFISLHQGFKDSGYDKLEREMSAAKKACGEIITQLHEVAKHIANYAVRLKEAAD